MKRLAPVASAIFTAIVVLIVFVFLPTSLGGRTTYLITSGTSMQPGFYQGDLVILRSANDFQIGDAVAYHDPEIGRVFHRIIDQDGRRFVLQGDNNTWLDSYRPTEEDIMGELWIHLPGVGKWVERARQPFALSMLAGIAGILIAVPARAAKRLKRAYRPPSTGRPERPQRNGSTAGILSQDGQMVMSIVGVAILLSGLLAVLAFTRSTERTESSPVAYQHLGSFEYSAEPTGTVYETGRVATGQPVYLSLVNEIDLTFDYSLTSDAPVETTGTYQIDAVVTFDEGLTRTIPLVAETRLAGTDVSATATLVLDDVRQIIDQIARQIGDERGTGQHEVSIVPTIRLGGTVSGQAIDETFAPSLDFKLDAVALRLEAPAVAPDGGPGTDPLKPVRASSVERVVMVPATISLLLIDLDVSAARQFALIALGLSILAGAVIAGMVIHALRSAEPYRIRARYGHLLIQVSGSDLGLSGRMVEVASIEDLARVAEREGRMILHQQRGSTHDYFVQDVDVTYRYQISNSRALSEPSISEVVA